MDTQLNRVTPEDLLKPENENQILVGGTNMLGRHGKGVALVGKKHWGAKDGRETGLTGQFFGIPTKVHWHNKLGMEPEQVRPYVNKMIECARETPNKTFLVTAIGCGYAGRTAEEMAPLFHPAVLLPNVTLPASFWEVLLSIMIPDEIRAVVKQIKGLWSMREPAEITHINMEKHVTE